MKWLFDLISFLFLVLRPPFDVKDAEPLEWISYFIFYLPLAISVWWFFPFLAVVLIVRVIFE